MSDSSLESTIRSVEQPASALVDYWNEGGEEKGEAFFLTLARHFAYALRAIFRSPTVSGATVLSMTLVFFVGLLWYSAYLSVLRLVEVPKEAIEVSIFLSDGLQEEERAEIQLALTQVSGVQRVLYVSEQEAFRRLEAALGSERQLLLRGFEGGEGLLPAALEVEIGAERDPSQVLAELQERFAGDPRIDAIRGADHLALVASQLAGAFGFISGVGALLFFLLSSALIASTLRLTFFGRREEVRVMTLHGASPAYIRTPFVCEAGIYCFTAALFSLALAEGTTTFLNGVWREFGLFELVGPVLAALSLTEMLVFILIVVLVALAGSLLTIRQLKEI